MANKSKPIVWGVKREGRNLWTRNAVKGVSVRGERRKRDGRIEWRRWDPTRSKVAAAILRTREDPSSLLPTPGSTCLYQGHPVVEQSAIFMISFVVQITTMEGSWSQLRSHLEWFEI